MSDLGASAAFLEIGSDPYGEREEESGLDVDVNLNNMPCSSQEIANTVLHKDEEKRRMCCMN